MSSFFVVWNRNGKPVDDSIPQKMLSGVKNPLCDGEDYWTSGPVMFAHQHFWITPEEVGEKQPIVEPVTGNVIVFTGRLDNRDELCHELRLDESKITKTSDACLVLEAYRKWGEETPRFLLGDFAFVIWDKNEQKIFAVRDQLGAQEMVYFINNRVLVITDRVATLLNHPEISPSLNETMVARFLSLDRSEEEMTFYVGVQHLPPAHYLVIDRSNIHKKQYWKVDFSRQTHYKKSEEYAEHYLDLLKGVVTTRLRSAYPVGVSLSGGIDSSSLACLIAEMLHERGLPQIDLNCFSYIFDHYPDCDERNYIQQVVEKVSSVFPVKSVLVYGDSLYPSPISEKWPILRDYPHQDPYQYLNDAILTSARQNGVRLLFNGLSGDDLYSGEDYLFADLMLERRFGDISRMLKRFHAVLYWKRALYDYGLRAIVPSEIKKWFRKFMPIAQEWTGWITPQFAFRNGLKPIFEQDIQINKYKKPGQQERYDALFSGAYSLSKSGYNLFGKINGVQGSFPFHDRRVVEFILTIPTDQIGLPGYSRRVLRNAMKGRLPESIRRRQGKASFISLFEKGIYQENWRGIKNLFSAPMVLDLGIINEDWLTRELEQKTQTREGYVFWLILSLELWLQKYWK